MPATASIRLNGTATPKETYKVGDTVTLTNNDNTSVSAWAWTLLSKPTGSTATLATPTAASSSFVVDKEGGYLVRLIVNDALPDEDQDTAVARVLTIHAGLHPHAKDETGEGDPTEGWARHWRESYITIDKRIGLAERRTVLYSGAASTGPKLLTLSTTASLPNGDVAPSVALASAGTTNSAIFLWDGGALATNDVLSVVTFGLSELFANPDALVAGDAVYAGAAGVLTKTSPAVGAYPVGYCAVVDGGNVRVWFTPAARAHGDQAGGTEHAEATSTTAGFQSAADKGKLDGLAGGNLIINGAMDLWQRGYATSIISNAVAGVERGYTADRFYGFVSNDLAAGLMSAKFTPQTGAAGNSRFSLRVEKNAVQPGGFMGFAQEIDRRFVEQVRGQKCTLRFKWKRGAGFTGAPVIMVRANVPAGTEDQWWGTYGGDTPIEVWFAPEPGTSFEVWTGTLADPLPTNIVGLSVLFGAYHDDAVGSGATDFLEFAEISMVAGEVAPASFAYAGGSLAGEIALCKHYYEKSWELGTDPNTATAVGAWRPTVPLGATAAAGAVIPASYPVEYETKRAFPTMTMFEPVGSAADSILLEGAACGVSFALTGTDNTSVVNASGAPVGPLTIPGVLGQWIADAEI